MMQDTNTRDDLKSFARLVDVLAPWLDQVVIVGGWAHRLYRLHPLAQPLEYEPLATFDTDVAMPDKLPHYGEGIGARLAASGFTEELLGDMRPPAIHYRLVAGSAGFYAEFLTPLIGSENKRGNRDATASIAGVSAQKLRHLELLLSAPWHVEIGPATGFPTTDRYLVKIPNPVTYLVQKILIHERREVGNRAKDLLYMHDTIEVFGGALPELKKVGMSRCGHFFPQRLCVQLNLLRRFCLVRSAIPSAMQQEWRQEEWFLLHNCWKPVRRACLPSWLEYYPAIPEAQAKEAL